MAGRKLCLSRCSTGNVGHVAGPHGAQPSSRILPHATYHAKKRDLLQRPYVTFRLCVFMHLHVEFFLVVVYLGALFDLNG